MTSLDMVQPFRLNDWLVDPAVNEISRDAMVIRIEERQMRVLMLLARHARQAVSAQEIEQVVWGDESVSPNSLHRAISQLRQALGDDARAPTYIQTVPRFGYRLIATVAAESPREKTSQPGSPANSDHFIETALEAGAAASVSEGSCDSITKVGARRRATLLGRPVLLGVAASLLILMVAGFIWESVEARRAVVARERADELTHFMVNVFSRDVVTSRPTAGELTDYAVQRISTDMPEQPETRAQMYEGVGISYINAALPERAVAPLRDALKIRRKIGQEANLATTLKWLGVAYWGLGKYEESASALRESLELFRKVKGESSAEYASTLGKFGRLELYRGHPDAALQLLNDSLQKMRAVVGAHHSNVADILLVISAAHLAKGELDRSERAVREAIEIYKHSRPRLDPKRVFAEMALGDTLHFQGRLDEAAKVLEGVRDAHRRLFGARSERFAANLEILGDVYFKQGRPADGERVMAEAMVILEGLRDRGRGSNTLASIKVSLATHVLELGQSRRAEQLLREALGLYTRSTSPPVPSPVAEYFLAEALLAQGRLEEAEPFARSALEGYSKSGMEPWFIERSKSTLGEILYRQGRKAEGEQLIRESSQRLASDASARPAARDRALQRVSLVSGRQ